MAPWVAVYPLHSPSNRYQSLLVKLVLWSHQTPKCHIGAQCTVEPTRRLNIREECCLQAKSTTEKVVMPPCYTMVVSRTWRGMLHGNMHISERVSPWGCAIPGSAGWRPKEPSVYPIDVSRYSFRY